MGVGAATTTTAEEEEGGGDPSLRSDALCDTLLSVVYAVTYPYRSQWSGEGAVGNAESGGCSEEALLFSLGGEALVRALARIATSSSDSASRALMWMFELVPGRSGGRGGAGGVGTVGPSSPYQRSEKREDRGVSSPNPSGLTRRSEERKS